MKAPIIIKCPIVPKGKCINLFGTIWTRDKSWIDRAVINHERIHTAQMVEMLVVLFYLWYVAEWLVRLVQYRNFENAYLNISFEREAYGNGHNLAYLPSRRRYAWLRYLREK